MNFNKFIRVWQLGVFLVFLGVFITFNTVPSKGVTHLILDLILPIGAMVGFPLLGEYILRTWD